MLKKDRKYRRNSDGVSTGSPTVKPHNNRVMCPDCGKSKMLFETEKKAENFIRWNGASLDVQHEMMRVYYCPACCGWHISHRTHQSRYDTQTDDMIHAYREHKTNSLTKIDKILRSREFEAQVLFVERESQRIFNELPAFIRSAPSKGTVKNYVARYLDEHRITDKDGVLRSAIYRIWKNNKERK